jgi:Big-like domain-containing protein
MLTGRRLPLALTFAVLVILAFGASCRGFFVKPTLTTIAVSPPTPTITNGTTNNTQQFTVVATFDDGSHGSTPVSWGSGTQTVATISVSGLATAVGLGTSTITAASTILPNISGTATLTVTLGCISSIDVTPHGPVNVRVGATQQFTATATPCAGSGTGTQDITNVATWNSSVTTVATISSSGLATTLTTGNTNITASSAGVTSPPQTLAVGP